jgi:Tol biopolymer transport system component
LGDGAALAASADEGRRRVTPERWQQIRDLLEQALELAPEQRAALLDRSCVSDPSLRQEVEVLLAASDDVRSSFLESSPTLRVTLIPGTKLGEYEVKSLLGTGGMGEVYCARDARLGRDVAIKVLPNLFAADTERLRRFEQEARAAAALNHPNILAVFQMGTYEGTPYLVSELLEGETLREPIKRGRIAVRKAIDYGAQIAHGLAAAHERGIFHRDLKPENLFVTKDGRVKILDFGLAKLTQPQAGSEPNAPTLAEHTEAGVVMGTAGYMSPEQVRGQKADHRTDIFSFGTILYEMLAGKRAFQKPTSPETMTAILNEDPPGISQVTTSIPAALQRVVHRCLEKNPEQRFQSSSDLAFALDALSETSSKAAESTISPQKRRRGIWIGLGGLVILAAAIGWAGYGFFLSRHVPFREIEITQLTTSGKVGIAAISPDGKYVAYSVNEAGTSYYFGGSTRQSLWVRQVTGGDVQVTPAAAVSFDGLTFSNDGDSLYVFRTESGSSQDSLYKMPVLGGTTKRLIANVDTYGKPALSPDGKQLAFVKGDSKRNESVLVETDEAGAAEKELAVRKWTSLLMNAAWSPDGKAIAVVAGNSESGSIEWDPLVVSIQNKSERLLTSKRWSYVRDLGWLSDGRGLIVTASERNSGMEQVQYVSYPGGQIRRITNDLNEYQDVSLTADSRIAATIQDKSSFDTWLAPMTDPDDARAVTSGGHSGEASWSPDGRIVYSETGGRGETNIWAMQPDGSNARQLTANLGLANRAPRVSEDGRYIVFISESVSPHLWRMDIDGNNATQLTNSPRDLLQVGSPALTPDGKWVLYGKWAPEWGIWKSPIEGGDPIQLNSTPYAACPAVSPDGKMLAYIYLDRSEKHAVAVMSLDGNTPEEHFDITTEIWRWSPDGRSLLFVKTENRVSNIWSQPISGGPPTQITHFKGLVMRSFDISRDGKQIAMNRGTTARDVVLIRDVLSRHLTSKGL